MKAPDDQLPAKEAQKIWNSPERLKEFTLNELKRLDQQEQDAEDASFNLAWMYRMDELERINETALARLNWRTKMRGAIINAVRDKDDVTISEIIAKHPDLAEIPSAAWLALTGREAGIASCWLSLTRPWPASSSALHVSRRRNAARGYRALPANSNRHPAHYACAVSAHAGAPGRASIGLYSIRSMSKNY